MDDPCNGCQRHPDECDCDPALDPGPIEAPPAETRRYRGRVWLVAPVAAKPDHADEAPVDWSIRVASLPSVGWPIRGAIRIWAADLHRMDGSDPGDEDPGPGLAATLRALFQGVQGSVFATWVSPGDEGKP